jgi:putative pyruvate formate lyase activating enzyme
LLDGIVDIYMPDFKLWEGNTVGGLAKAEDYPDRAREAILGMNRQVGVLKLPPDGVADRGILVRHRVISEQGIEPEQVCHWLAEKNYLAIPTLASRGSTGRHTRWGGLPGVEPRSAPR